MTENIFKDSQCDIEAVPVVDFDFSVKCDISPSPVPTTIFQCVPPVVIKEPANDVGLRCPIFYNESEIRVAYQARPEDESAACIKDSYIKFCLAQKEVDPCTYDLKLDLNVAVPRPPCEPTISPGEFAFNVGFSDCLLPKNTINVRKEFTPAENCDEFDKCEFFIDLELDIPIPRLPCPEINVKATSMSAPFSGYDYDEAGNPVDILCAVNPANKLAISLSDGLYEFRTLYYCALTPEQQQWDTDVGLACECPQTQIECANPEEYPDFVLPISSVKYAFLVAPSIGMTVTGVGVPPGAVVSGLVYPQDLFDKGGWSNYDTAEELPHIKFSQNIVAYNGTALTLAGLNANEEQAVVTLPLTGVIAKSNRFEITTKHTPGTCSEPGTCVFDLDLEVFFPIPRTPCPEITVTTFDVATAYDADNCLADKETRFEIITKHRPPENCNDTGNCSFEVELELAIPIPLPTCPVINQTLFDVTTSFVGEAIDLTCTNNKKNAFSITTKHIPATCNTAPRCEFDVGLEIFVPIPRTPCPVINDPELEVSVGYAGQACVAGKTNSFTITTKHTAPENCTDAGKCEFDIALEIAVPIPEPICPVINIASTSMSTAFSGYDYDAAGNPVDILGAIAPVTKLAIPIGTGPYGYRTLHYCLSNTAESRWDDWHGLDCCPDPNTCANSETAKFAFLVTPAVGMTVEGVGVPAGTVVSSLVYPQNIFNKTGFLIGGAGVPYITFSNPIVAHNATLLTFGGLNANKTQDAITLPLTGVTTKGNRFEITTKHTPNTCNEPGTCEFDFDLEVHVPIPRTPCPEINVTDFSVNSGYFGGALSCVKNENTFSVTTTHRPPENANDPGQCSFDIKLEINVPIPEPTCPIINTKSFQVTSSFTGADVDGTCTDNKTNKFLISTRHTPATCTEAPKCEFDVELEVFVPIPRTPCPEINVNATSMSAPFTGLDYDEEGNPVDILGAVEPVNKLVIPLNSGTYSNRDLYYCTSAPEENRWDVPVGLTCCPEPNSCTNWSTAFFAFLVTPAVGMAVTGAGVPPDTVVSGVVYPQDPFNRSGWYVAGGGVPYITFSNPIVARNGATITFTGANNNNVQDSVSLPLTGVVTRSNRFEITTKHTAPENCTDPGTCTFDIDLEVHLPIPRTPCPTISSSTFLVSTGFADAACMQDAKNVFSITAVHVPPTSPTDPGQCAFDIALEIAVPIPRPPCPNISTSLSQDVFYDNACARPASKFTVTKTVTPGDCTTPDQCDFELALELSIPIPVPLCPEIGVNSFAVNVGYAGSQCVAGKSNQLSVTPTVIQNACGTNTCRFDIDAEINVPIPQPPCVEISKGKFNVNVGYANCTPPNSKFTISKTTTAPSGCDVPEQCAYTFDLDINVPIPLPKCPTISSAITTNVHYADAPGLENSSVVETKHTPATCNDPGTCNFDIVTVVDVPFPRPPCPQVQAGGTIRAGYNENTRVTFVALPNNVTNVGTSSPPVCSTALVLDIGVRIPRPPCTNVSAELNVTPVPLGSTPSGSINVIKDLRPGDNCAIDFLIDLNIPVSCYPDIGAVIGTLHSGLQYSNFITPVVHRTGDCTFNISIFGAVKALTECPQVKSSGFSVTKSKLDDNSTPEYSPVASGYVTASSVQEGNSCLLLLSGGIATAGLSGGTGKVGPDYLGTTTTRIVGGRIITDVELQIGGCADGEGGGGLQGPKGDKGDRGPMGPEGPMGPMGFQGAAGPAGQQGAPGAAGPIGPRGFIGPAGPAGPIGPQGATGAGFTGATGVSGPSGASGPTGVTGATGCPGQKGNPGATGAVGATGATGVTGPVGATGPVGPVGETGLRGDTGEKGETGPVGVTGATGIGITGATGASGATGPTGPGPLVRNTSNISVIEFSSGAPNSQGQYTWVELRAVSGPTGPRGATGIQGPAGSMGMTGLTGPQGIRGQTGPKGDTGQTGATGATGVGVTGATGAVGATGASITGATGATGLQGVEGPEGPPGPMGLQGLRGQQGVTGPQGPQGQQGQRGEKGEKGATGISGPTGSKGQTGATGARGERGSAGPEGARGATGPRGATGAVGPIGITGATGAGATGATGPTGPAPIARETDDSSIIEISSGNPDGEGNYTWVELHAVTGATGPCGQDGATGPRGFLGATGATGPIGATGAIGVAGPIGLQGTTGPTGVTGATGIAGPTGLQGPTGVVGATGLNGVTGATGPTGPQGATGPLPANAEITNAFLVELQNNQSFRQTLKPLLEALLNS
jgi:hypothetical protein